MGKKMTPAEIQATFKRLMEIRDKLRDHKKLNVQYIMELTNEMNETKLKIEQHFRSKRIEKSGFISIKGDKDETNKGD